jgi:hypothetical protein
VREIVDADVEKLLQVRIRRISLFDINKHREEMEKTKANSTRRARISRASRNTSSAISKRCWKNTARSIRA